MRGIYNEKTKPIYIKLPISLLNLIDRKVREAIDRGERMSKTLYIAKKCGWKPLKEEQTPEERAEYQKQDQKHDQEVMNHILSKELEACRRYKEENQEVEPKEQPKEEKHVSFDGYVKKAVEPIEEIKEEYKEIDVKVIKEVE